MFGLASAVFGVLVALAGVAHASERLSESPLGSLFQNFNADLPVDPDGQRGPKRVAGYFKLDRTVVRCPSC
jgi:hypothetical protein